MPPCWCFKHNFSLGKEVPLFQLVTLHWTTLFEFCSIIAEPCFCLLVRHYKAAWQDRSCSELLPTGPFLLVLKKNLCSQPQSAYVPAPGMQGVDELNVNLVPCQVKVGSMEMEISPARRISLLFGILSWITQIARVSTF